MGAEGLPKEDAQESTSAAWEIDERVKELRQKLEEEGKPLWEIDEAVREFIKDNQEKEKAK